MASASNSTQQRKEARAGTMRTADFHSVNRVTVSHHSLRVPTRQPRVTSQHECGVVGAPGFAASGYNRHWLCPCGGRSGSGRGCGRGRGHSRAAHQFWVGDLSNKTTAALGSEFCGSTKTKTSKTPRWVAKRCAAAHRRILPGLRKAAVVPEDRAVVIPQLALLGVLRTAHGEIGIRHQARAASCADGQG